MKKRIFNLIHEYETIIIHRHSHPDLDALGSQSGLAEMIKTIYPHKQVYAVGAEEKKFMFLNRMDHIADDVYNGALIIVCDTDHKANISDNRFEKGDLIIKIDHHPDNEPYGDIAWIDNSASSVSEMIYDLYEHGKERGYVLTKKAAFLLYAGIIGDTGRFMFKNTTQKTLNIGGELLSYGFSTDGLFAQLKETELRLARLKGYILQYFQITPSGIGFIKLNLDTLGKFHTTANDALQLINVFSNVRNIKVWVFFIEEMNQINVRLRSNEIAVNKLAKNYSGGGHAYSSGMAINTWEKADEVIYALEDMCCEFHEAVI